MVTSRTYNQSSEGTYGQFIPAVQGSEVIPSGVPVPLVQLSDSASYTSGYRSNIGLVNTGIGPIDVRIDLFDGLGITLGTRTVSLRPYEYTQIDRIFRTVTTETLDDAYVILSTATEGGSFLAYASVVDNRSGDPVYIPGTLAGVGGVILARPDGDGPSLTASGPPVGGSMSGAPAPRGVATPFSGRAGRGQASGPCSRGRSR